MFAQQFADFVSVRHADKPQTVDFCTKKLKQVLNFEPIREARIDRVDEALIECYVVWRRQRVTITTTNRELATIRRLLHLAQEWKVIRSVPRVRLLTGERQREFVLNHEQETRYLAATPEPLKSLATLLLDTGLRPGEALNLKKADVCIEATGPGRFGRLLVRSGKSKNAKRTVPLADRVARLLKSRLDEEGSEWIFPGETTDRPLLATSVAHSHTEVCRAVCVER